MKTQLSYLSFDFQILGSCHRATLFSASNSAAFLCSFRKELWQLLRRKNRSFCCCCCFLVMSVMSVISIVPWCDCVIDSYILIYIVFISFRSTKSGTRSLSTWQKHVKRKHNGTHIVFFEAWRVCGAKERESMFTSSFQCGWLSG